MDNEIIFMGMFHFLCLKWEHQIAMAN